MKTTAALLLAAGTCGAGFLAGWLVFHSDGTCKIDLPPTQPLQRAEQPDRSIAVSNSAPDLEKPDSRVAIQSTPVEVPAVPAPVAQPIANTTTPVPAEPDPRYLPETTLSEMTDKRLKLAKYYMASVMNAISQRFQEGLAEHVFNDPDWKEDPEAAHTFIYGTRPAANGQGWDRAVLPRSQFGNLYFIKDDLERLNQLINDTWKAERDAATNR